MGEVMRHLVQAAVAACTMPQKIEKLEKENRALLSQNDRLRDRCVELQEQHAQAVDELVEERHALEALKKRQRKTNELGYTQLECDQTKRITELQTEVQRLEYVAKTYNNASASWKQRARAAEGSEARYRERLQKEKDSREFWRRRALDADQAKREHSTPLECDQTKRITELQTEVKRLIGLASAAAEKREEWKQRALTAEGSEASYRKRLQKERDNVESIKASLREMTELRNKWYTEFRQLENKRAQDSNWKIKYERLRKTAEAFEKNIREKMGEREAEIKELRECNARQKDMLLEATQTAHRDQEKRRLEAQVLAYGEQISYSGARIRQLLETNDDLRKLNNSQSHTIAELKKSRDSAKFSALVMAYGQRGGKALIAHCTDLTRQRDDLAEKRKRQSKALEKLQNQVTEQNRKLRAWEYLRSYLERIVIRDTYHSREIRIGFTPIQIPAASDDRRGEDLLRELRP